MKESSSEYSNESLELLKKEVLSLKNHISRSLKSHLSDVKADFHYQSILKNKVFSDEYDFPVATITSWSVALELGCWLYDTIIKQRPKVVVEFGSGLSTLIMAIALNRSSGGRLIAVEHDAEYFKKTSDLLRDAGLLDKVELLLCPLVDVEVHATTYKWYALTDAVLENYLKEEKVDLLFVDGPPAAAGPKARFPAYSLIKEFLSENALIVLDDVNRPDEMEIANSWVDESEGKLVVQRTLSVRHGAVVLTADQEWESIQKQVLNADVQLSDIDVSTPFTEELVSLVRNRQVSRDLAANLMMRHQLHVEQELNKYQMNLLEQSSIVSSARVSMALAINGLTALEYVLDAAEKQLCIPVSEKDREIISIKLNNREDFSLQSLVPVLDSTQQYIAGINNRFTSVVKYLFDTRNELQDIVKGLERNYSSLEVDCKLLEQKNSEQIIEISDKEHLLSKLLEDAEKLQQENAALQAEFDRMAVESATLAESFSVSQRKNEELAIKLEQCEDSLNRVVDKAELLNQENKTLKNELNEERSSHAYSIEKLKKSRRNYNYKEIEFAILEKSLVEKVLRLSQLEKLEEERNWAESRLREVYGVLRKIQSENYRYASTALVESERADKIKKHLSYRLGAVMIENSSSVKGWLSMPWALRNAYREFGEYRDNQNVEKISEAYFQTVSLNRDPLVIALDTNWHELYINESDVVSQVNISLITVKQGVSIGFEWMLTDCGSDSYEEVENALELFESQSTALCEIDSKTTKCLRVRKSRGVPAWIKIERVKYEKNDNRLEISSGKKSLITEQESVTHNIAGKAIELNTEIEDKPEQIKLDAVLTVRQSAERRTTLLEAHTLIENGEVDRGLQYAKDNANGDEVHGIAILEANQALNNDEQWLRAVNRYISRLGIAPVELLSSKEERFFRFTTQALPPIEDGPLVSVIMPAYNCASTLEFAANSILQQQWRNLELIIIDDCSADDTWQVMRKIAIRDPRVRILRNSVNCGPYVSKNRAVDIARGEYITGHDSDDWAHPERLAGHMRAVQADDKPVYASAIKMIRLRSNGKFERISATTVNTVDGVMQTAFISTLFNADFLRTKLGHWDCARFAADSEIISRCQALLGDRFIIYEQLGMLCLDADDGLTAHPVHGTRGRTAPSRKHYKRAFLAWHEELKTKGESYVLPFPHSPRKFPAPKAIAVSNSDLQRIAREDKNGRSFDLDVCILTDLRYPGGTASSTLDELHTCLSQGLRVRVFHCPTEFSVGKPISSRYYQDVEHIEVQDFDVSVVRTKVLIVRHPMVICSDAYASLSKRIQADSIVYVINNSRYRANGDDAFDLMRLRNALTLLSAGKQAKVYPLGPRIRKELENELLPIELASEDWHPLFDSSYYNFRPKDSFSRPIVIGRHGRDQIDKWPSSKKDLLTVYPESNNVHLKVLGGASIVKKLLGRIPKNWTVLPFGAMEPSEFLNSLDVFVYFPSEGLNEAFGRTVMEAIFSGVPCVLPVSFKESFGDLVFYSDVANVQSVISRLSEKDKERNEFVSLAREKAFSRFDSNVLMKRLNSISGSDLCESFVDEVDDILSLSQEMYVYKNWVEKG